MIYTLNPSKIIIGGGITAQKEYLEPLIINSVNKKLINKKFIKPVYMVYIILLERD